jgi:hypothetical protein
MKQKLRKEKKKTEDVYAEKILRDFFVSRVDTDKSSFGSQEK